MKATVKLTKKELFAFLFYHMYLRPSGLLYLLVGLASIGGGIYYLVKGNHSGIFLIVIAGVYFILQPVMLYLQAARQAKNEVFSKNTYYEFGEEGITVWQDDVEPATLQWQNVTRFAKTKNYDFVYVDRAHGNIIPRSMFECDPREVDELVIQKVPKKNRKGFSR